ncbi:hypothetical protein [Stigmatella aurantiaca]|uniref:Conserved uncharacterized protein n=1 Tax=Stigmatella aurantiaca (strain DW4/3-1) TaxID=378806 RepID=Q090Z7_STIAD|nr:hypothetical protein [Stigmatella aurantiaca]ADO71689.1 conserved uncharacterized protein [Stigmatella aurantiaca DW4/3-1]EAU66284.1 hypothetical protein STIAU_2539 [Stigmatella aurantiaca DW4/3-1]
MDSSSNVIAELTIEALRASEGKGLPFYEQLLCSSFEACVPPFSKRWYGEAYREQAADPAWLARSLVTNAEKEAEGARMLWRMAGLIESPEIAEQVRRHAIDESNHARYYIAMLNLAFPGCADEGVQTQLDAISPRYSVRERPERGDAIEEPVLTLDALVQMNIGEIRTRVHQLLLYPIIMRHSPPEQHARLKGVLETITADETRHIAYTAQAMEAAARGGSEALVRDMLFSRLEQFCALTLKELETHTFDGA